MSDAYLTSLVCLADNLVERIEASVGVDIDDDGWITAEGDDTMELFPLDMCFIGVQTRVFDIQIGLKREREGSIVNVERIRHVGNHLCQVAAGSHTIVTNGVEGSRQGNFRQATCSKSIISNCDHRDAVDAFRNGNRTAVRGTNGSVRAVAHLTGSLGQHLIRHLHTLRGVSLKYAMVVHLIEVAPNSSTLIVHHTAERHYQRSISIAWCETISIDFYRSGILHLNALQTCLHKGILVDVCYS